MGCACSSRSWCQYIVCTIPIFMVFYGYYAWNTNGTFEWTTRNIMDLAGLLSVALIASFLLTNIIHRHVYGDEEPFEPTVHYHDGQNRRNALLGLNMPQVVLEPRDPIVNGDMYMNGFFECEDEPIQPINGKDVEHGKIKGMETAV